ncbi:MAG: glycosyltransferase [Methylotenera sp.]|uniref:glycosyltransferase n=1 Tax=Methylotenera sp. TaxID=2051956 RepID=UPI0027287CD2|nr:glycosyltransferase [Methylotenera sp.]MDO9150503.1 glycosyltransferase [Methylotenera sp.]
MYSVVVTMAAYNGSQWIKAQTESILSQKNVNITLVVSVDLSSDITKKIVQDIALKNTKVVFLTDGERFGSASANFFRLIRDADLDAFDYIALSDQDDIWQADKLPHAINKIQENNIDAYSSNVTAFWPNGQQRLINKAQPQQQWDYMFESAGPGCTFVLTRKLGLEIQAFLIENQTQCQQVALHDWFIYAFARSRGFKWLIDHESHMLYRQHAVNVVGANVGIKAKIQRFKKLREGWLFEQALIIAEILGYTNMPPIQKIKRLSLLDRVWLIFNVSKLRRRLRDRIALAFFMMLFVKK